MSLTRLRSHRAGPASGAATDARADPSHRFRGSRPGWESGSGTPSEGDGGDRCQHRARGHTKVSRASCLKRTGGPRRQAHPRHLMARSCFFPSCYHYLKLPPWLKSLYVLKSMPLFFFTLYLENFKHVSKWNNLMNLLLFHLLPTTMFEANPSSRPWKSVFLKDRELFLECMTTCRDARCH